MSSFKGRPFQAVDSTEPSFNATAGAVSALFALESTATNRFWRNPSNRAVRIAAGAADDFSVVFGSSNIVATSSGGILVLGGTVESHYVAPGQSHIALVSSTDITANVTLGVGS